MTSDSDCNFIPSVIVLETFHMLYCLGRDFTRVLSSMFRLLTHVAMENLRKSLVLELGRRGKH